MLPQLKNIVDIPNLQTKLQELEINDLKLFLLQVTKRPELDYATIWFSTPQILNTSGTSNQVDSSCIKEINQILKFMANERKLLFVCTMSSEQEYHRNKSPNKEYEINIHGRQDRFHTSVSHSQIYLAHESI